ncbi:Peroxidase 45 [Linum grandiflorum]
MAAPAGHRHHPLVLILLLVFLFSALLIVPSASQLSPDFYRNTCPNVVSIVRSAVRAKFQQTFVTAPATLRLFFHDCFVRGCDASVLLASPTNNAEKDHPDDVSLAGDGFDTVIKAKAAVDRIPSCRNKVSCADILALATREAVILTGGPFYRVELGRRDGRISTKSSVQHKLPHANFNLNQYAMQLRQMCPVRVDPRIAINMDPTTPQRFDNAYYRNLQQGKGLFTSDQVLFTDPRSRPTVNRFAASNTAFGQAFVAAITKLGRVGVLTGSRGEIRRDCSRVN